MRTLKYAHSFEVEPSLLPELEPLRKLATNLRWTWHQPTRDLFQAISGVDCNVSGYAPVQVLQGLGEEHQAALTSNKKLMEELRRQAQSLESYLSSASSYDAILYPQRPKPALIAYFCAEFGIHESLPIYSGGLGVLAGDHLKECSDMGVPLVGVGLLYQRGYFRQELTPDGWQQENYPNSDFYELPISQVRDADDNPLLISVQLADRLVHCRIWRADVGRIPLYLLDSNLLENDPHDQAITDTLYGGDEEMRMRQEIVLGIGGFRALRAMGLDPTVCHMNEGHAAFLTLERIRDFMKRHDCDFRTARQCVVAGNVFTTHTPVPAGFDVFTREMLAKYLATTIEELGISFDHFLGYGRIHPELDEPFNMALLAMSNSSHVNGVSRLHAEVTRKMFGVRWPDYPAADVPIQAVTNGIHTASWIGPRMHELLTRSGSDDPQVHVFDWWKNLENTRDEELWEVRNQSRQDLVQFVRSRIHQSYGQASEPLDPNILTIGFARRFATYKRATLLFQDRERLKRILTHPDRPVQFVFAGKAHPRDDGGKRLIQDIKRFIEEEKLKHRMVFLEDYDIGIGRELVRGVDVWLNNPRRPQEASGTSGMKVVPNGGLNCSIRDGWWAEAYSPDVGWAIGNRFESSDEARQDWLDAQSLYELLEQEITPRFYDRNAENVPSAWMTMVRTSMERLGPEFCTYRMVKDYIETAYAPASRRYRWVSARGQARAKKALEWKANVKAAWPSVRISEVSRDLKSRPKRGESGLVTARVELGPLRPQDVRVDLIYGPIGSNREIVDPHRLPMRFVESSGDAAIFQVELKAEDTGQYGSVVRVSPCHRSVTVDMELPLVVWEEAK